MCCIVQTAEEIRSNFQVNGLMPLTTRDLNGFCDQIKNLRTDILAELPALVQQARSHSMDVGLQKDIADPLRQYGLWNWQDGQIGHGVPKDWRWPTRITVKGLMDLWWFGKDINVTEGDGSVRTTRIRPYRLINRKFDVSEGDQMNYTRAQGVAKHMEYIIGSRGLLPEGVTQCKDLTLTQAHDVFPQAYEFLLDQLSTVANIRRNQDITCGTVYKYLTQLKKREVANGDEVAVRNS